MTQCLGIDPSGIASHLDRIRGLDLHSSLIWFRLKYRKAAIGWNLTGECCTAHAKLGLKWFHTHCVIKTYFCCWRIYPPEHLISVSFCHTSEITKYVTLTVHLWAPWNQYRSFKSHSHPFCALCELYQCWKTQWKGLLPFEIMWESNLFHRAYYPCNIKPLFALCHYRNLQVKKLYMSLNNYVAYDFFTAFCTILEGFWDQKIS